ncbi:hypothetical protein ACKGJO_09220 [Gracilimonas sp. Q87]|uniref:hypothetical protein n=1 Tax=Gracilimonas sp. Q87 TaxID=3384766 RepID=UPI003983ED1B
MEELGIGVDKSINDAIKQHEDIETFEMAGYCADDQLQCIAEQIRLRTKRTKSDIFTTGELLYKAKDICLRYKRGYKKWFNKQDIDFSYETGQNYVHVFEQCFSNKNIALQIPRSILYELSAPSFPEQLREFLFEQGNFDEIKDGELKNLKKKYEDGGIEAVQGDIKELNRTELVKRQVHSRLDLIKTHLNKLNKLKDKFRAGMYGKEVVEFDVQLEWLEPEASEISKTLYKEIELAYDNVDKAVIEAEQQLDKLADEILEQV